MRVHWLTDGHMTSNKQTVYRQTSIIFFYLLFTSLNIWLIRPETMKTSNIISKVTRDKTLKAFLGAVWRGVESIQYPLRNFTNFKATISKAGGFIIHKKCLR